MSTQKTIRILQLYPRDMNIYGDWGNTLVLKKRLEWHGYRPELLEYNPGDAFPDAIDIVVGGGGQDSGQSRIQTDLISHKQTLVDLANDNVPMLVVCGLYQLFGNFFKTREGETINGVGIFDSETHGGDQRIIGNIVTHSEEFGDIIGYENHSGLTTLGQNVEPLGIVKKGEGNNTDDSTEGARYKNVIGTYLHGSILPKNPAIADWLIKQSVIRRHGKFTPSTIDDTLIHTARTIACKRPR